MASGYETVMVDVLARLKAAGARWPAAADVKRAHRTAVPRDRSPAVHLVDGTDEPDKNKSKGACACREGTFTVSLFVRSDDGQAATDALKIETMRRLNPELNAYDDGVDMSAGRISFDSEIGDSDPIRVDMEFSFYYPAAEWAL